MEVVRKETDPRFKYHMFKRSTRAASCCREQLRNGRLSVGPCFPGLPHQNERGRRLQGMHERDDAGT